MTKIENLFVILMEECDEVSQRASKCLRFTHTEIQPDINQNPKQLTNAQRLVYEFNDLLAVMELLEEEGIVDLDDIADDKAVKIKKEKVKKYLEYSKKLGTVC